MTDAHSLAHCASQSLCDLLFEELSRHVPDLRRTSTLRSCGIFREGTPRFAYVYHTKSKPQIEVWCRGVAKNLVDNDPGLGVSLRSKFGPGWEQSFPARFRLHSESLVPKAAAFLLNHSYQDL